MATTSGEAILSVALLQDIAAIPILALVPFLAAGVGSEGGAGWLGAAKAIGTIAVIILGGRLLLRPALRWIANSETPEIFTAASLLLVVATAALMNAVGLSMALGAFLAGRAARRKRIPARARDRHRAVQGTSPRPLLHRRRHEHRLRGRDGTAAAHRGGRGRLPADQGRRALGDGAHDADPAARRPVFVILLAQGGEFGFVVFQTAALAGVISAPVSSFLVAAVTISMLLTPLLLFAADRWWIRSSPAASGRSRRSRSRSTSRSSSPASAATGRSSAGCCSPTA
jgi:glutathione-regulated potassium-efflux system ancillary protein KefC